MRLALSLLVLLALVATVGVIVLWYTIPAVSGQSNVPSGWNGLSQMSALPASGSLPAGYSYGTISGTQCKNSFGDITLNGRLEWVGSFAPTSHTAIDCATLSGVNSQHAQYFHFALTAVSTVDFRALGVGGFTDTYCSIWQVTPGHTPDLSKSVLRRLEYDDEDGGGSQCRIIRMDLPAGNFIIEVAPFYPTDNGDDYGGRITISGLANLTPAAPTLGSITASANSVTFNWTTSSGPVPTSWDIRQRITGGSWLETVGVGVESVGTWSHTLPGLKYETTYEIAVRGVNSDGNGAWAQYPDIATGAAPGPLDAIVSTPIPPTPDANTVRLVSRVGYTLDVEELNLLEVRGTEGTLGNVGKVSFVCQFTDSGEVEVSDTPVAYSETSDVVMHKRPVERKSTAASTLLAVSSRTIQEATCSARLYATSASTNFNETNSVSLRFQKKGTTWFRKEEAFDNTPGGSDTWLFLPPLVIGGLVAGATRNAGGTLVAVGVALGGAVWFTEAPPVLWVLVVLSAVGGVLLMVQLGFRGR